MTLFEQEKLAKHIQRLLKIRYVQIPIATTEKGPLSIKFTKDQEEFDLILDAVPLAINGLDNENNRELKILLCKYLFDSQPDPDEATLEEAKVVNVPQEPISTTEPIEVVAEQATVEQPVNEDVTGAGMPNA